MPPRHKKLTQISQINCPIISHRFHRPHADYRRKKNLWNLWNLWENPTLLPPNNLWEEADNHPLNPPPQKKSVKSVKSVRKSHTAVTNFLWETSSRHWDDFCSGRGGKNREIKRKICQFRACLRLISLCNILINSVLYVISQISRLDTAYFSTPWFCG